MSDRGIKKKKKTLNLLPKFKIKTTEKPRFLVSFEKKERKARKFSNIGRTCVDFTWQSLAGVKNLLSFPFNPST